MIRSFLRSVLRAQLISRVISCRNRGSVSAFEDVAEHGLVVLCLLNYLIDDHL